MNDTFDRDAARDVLREHRAVSRNAEASMQELLDALEACVRPAPAQRVDREQIMIALSDYETEVWEIARRNYGTLPSQGAYADRILALLRPVDGVTLTREECGHAADWHDYIVDHGGDVPTAETELAVRLRAGAAS